ncbi:methyltransferase [Candidatus Dojkabacteria bacterium]|nr:methyltransferase [Candidatus Dojkabacteria bacterium]
MYKVVKLDHKGRGIYFDSNSKKKFLFWNALPGEQVSYTYSKNKKGNKICIANKIKNRSKDRIKPLEPDHYISCSPWQIMNFDFESKIKKKIAKEKLKFIKNSREKNLISNLQIYSNGLSQFAYRNKIEFSFYIDDQDKLHLAFFRRGTHKSKIPIKGCQLAEGVINQSAGIIVDWLNSEIKTHLNTKQKQIGRYFKTLILRSNNQNECIAALYLRKKISFKSFPKLNSSFLGFHIYYSDPKSPASVPTKILYSNGQNYLEASINKTKLQFGINSFFQINIPVFEQALKDISQFLHKDDHIIDLYSGVGAISLPNNKSYKECILVEINKEAIKYANLNIENNNISNCRTILAPCREVVELFHKKHTVILDPPREGLHKKVVKSILNIKPKKIIYLSCNINSQISDLKKLETAYGITFIKLYNFFPRTPHIESLIILEKGIV